MANVTVLDSDETIDQFFDCETENDNEVIFTMRVVTVVIVVFCPACLDTRWDSNEDPSRVARTSRQTKTVWRHEIDEISRHSVVCTHYTSVVRRCLQWVETSETRCISRIPGEIPCGIIGGGYVRF